MKNYFRSTAVVLALIAFLAQACGENKNSTNVQKAGPRGDLGTAAADAGKKQISGNKGANGETKPIEIVDGKINFSILNEKLEVSVDGDPTITPKQNKNEDETDAGSTTVDISANLLINGHKVEVSTSHKFVKLTELGLAARTAANEAISKQTEQLNAQRKVDNAKKLADEANKKAEKSAKEEDKKAATDANAALETANKELNTATEAANKAVAAANDAKQKADEELKKDTKAQEIDKTNRAAQVVTKKLDPVNGLNYDIEISESIPNENSSMSYLTVRLAASGKSQTEKSTRAFIVAFGKSAKQPEKNVVKLALESESALSKDIAEAQLTLTKLLFNDFPPTAR